MDQLEMHLRAQDTFARIAAGVVDDDLAKPTPCPAWTVQDLVDHVIGGNQWVVVRGGGQPDPLPEGRSAAIAASAAHAHAVFSTDDGLTRTFELPFGNVPGAVFAAIRSGDLYTHAWDLATAIGADTNLDPELGEAIHAAVSPFLGDSLRGEGRPFGVRQPCDPERPIADRLAAFLGRPVG